MKSFMEWMESRFGDWEDHFDNDTEADHNRENDQRAGWDRFAGFIGQGWTWADVAGPTEANDGKPIGNPSEKEKAHIKSIVSPNLQLLPITKRSIRFLKGKWIGWKNEHPDGLGMELPDDGYWPKTWQDTKAVIRSDPRTWPDR